MEIVEIKWTQELQFASVCRVSLPDLASDDLRSASVAVDRIGFNHHLEIPPLFSDKTDRFKFWGSQQIARSLCPLRRNAGYDNDRLARRVA
jgi:hypothetical protein